MSKLTTDRNDPDLGYGYEDSSVEQNKKYLILSEEERAKGFVRPVRRSYVHVGKKVDLRGGIVESLSPEDKARHGPNNDYVAFIRYPESESPIVGRAINQKELDNIGNYIGGCGTLTTMSLPIAETYARDPKFYGSTYCCGCSMHRPVEEFIWDGTDELVGS